MLTKVADDLGLAEPVNDGIVFLLKNNHINSASIMANGRAFDDAVSKLKALTSFDGGANRIGIHFVLVEEKPVLDPRAVSSLVTSHGLLFRNHRIFFVKYLLGLIKKSDIERELEAQIQKCFAAGVKLSFINTHQHLHLLPGILKIVIRLAKKYGVGYIRVVNEPFRGVEVGWARKLQLRVLNWLSAWARVELKRHGLACNDVFIGFLHAGNLNRQDVGLAIDIARRYPDQQVELGAHPGYETEELRRNYAHWGGYHWQNELEILKF